MGMFDNVLIDIERLPITDAEKKILGNGHVFQTKDLDCILSNAEITDDGYLEFTYFDYDIVPEHERPYPNEPGIMGMIGSMRTVNERTERLKEQFLNFYTYTKCGKWFEFNAQFDTDGKLTKIDRVVPSTD